MIIPGPTCNTVRYFRLIELIILRRYQKLSQSWKSCYKQVCIDLYVHKRRLSLFLPKELSRCHKLKRSRPYIFATWWRKPLIFQTSTIWSNRIHSVKYVRSTTLGCKDTRIRKSEFVTKTQFLYSLQLETLGAHKIVIFRSAGLKFGWLNRKL